MSVELEPRNEQGTNNPQPQNNNSPPGKGKATASLVLGIISICFSYVVILGLACGIIGLVMAAGARKDGFDGGLRKGGLVCSIIGTVFSAIYTLIVLLLVGTIASSPWWML